MTEKEIIRAIDKRIYDTNRSQTEVANKLGIAKTTLNRFLAGRATLGFEKVCAICEELGMDISVSSEEPSEEGTDESEEEEEPNSKMLTKEQYRIKMLKLRGSRGMEYDSKLYLAYQKLANAIIIMAVDDYREIASNGKLSCKIGSKYSSIEGIEKFFKSDYYKGLTDVDGEYIIERLKEEQNGK